jgi:O-antigen/teichoic acid export membrane protein
MTQLKHLSLRRNFSWMFSGNVVFAATQWGMLAVLAKMGTPEMVGQLALGLAIAAPVLMFTNLQLQVVQATDARRQFEFNDYLALRLVSTALALFLILAIVFVSGYRLETALVICMVGLSKAFDSMSDVFYGLLLQRERMDRVAKSLTLRGLLSLIALSLGVYFTGSVVGGVVGVILAWALVLLVYDIRSGSLVLQASSRAISGLAAGKALATSNLRPRWSLRTLYTLARLALPLGLVLALMSLTTNIPRYFVERYLGEGELGIFAAISYIMVAGLTVTYALGQATSARLARYYAEGEEAKFLGLLLRLVGIGTLLGIAGVLVSLVAGQEILALLYRPEYAERVDIFLWLMIAAAIMYVASLLGYGMTAARYFRVQVPLFAFAGGISAVACLWLVPAAGLKGASIALIISALVQFGGCLAVTVYALKVLRRKIVRGS